MSLRRPYSAVTLLELVIVVTIIGILTTIGLTQYTVFSWKARLNEVYTIASLVAKAEKMYHMEHGAYTTCNPNTMPSGCEFGNTIAAGTTSIQRDLKISFPSSSSFRYLVYPSDASGCSAGCPTETSVYFAEPGHDWAWAYNYRDRNWWHYCAGAGTCSGIANEVFEPKPIE